MLRSYVGGLTHARSAAREAPSGDNAVSR